MAQVPIVFPSPQMALVLYLDELCRYSHPLRIAPHAALDNMLDPQIPSDLGNRLLRVLILHHRSPGNYPEMTWIEVSELADHLFGQSIAEIFLPRIPGEILKWQHRQHDSARLLSRAAPRTPRPNGICHGQGECDCGECDDDDKDRVSPIPSVLAARLQLNIRDTSPIFFIGHGHRCL